jgi:serine/threonine protein kinase/Tol biopolymer transport system component
VCPRPSDRWQRLERLYHSARECAPAERSAFLDDACGDDTTLRRELESMLAQKGDGFLETPALRAAAHVMSATDTAAFTGRTLGVYQIHGCIGVGGMGEVYSAHDTKLGREVAIKVLPRSFSDDADRRARFEREAHVLAALNHPHIAQIYGFEEFDGVRALVMELIEGCTLGEMIRGRTRSDRMSDRSMTEAFELARQIADALSAAHEKGIIHRDLKPANIKITPAGVVKVLDFGLAKATGPAAIFEEHAAVPITGVGTRQPVVLGTAAYMSPEQARGLAVDKRTDIWAFGCVLYEMLSGRRPFDGDTLPETVALILEREPDWGLMPAATPASIRALLDRCLRKDPRRRLHDIADARLELEEADRPTSRDRVLPPPSARTRERDAWILAAAAAVAVGVAHFRSLPPVEEPQEIPVVPPQSWAFETLMPSPAFEISPDGRQLAVAVTSQDVQVLWVRPIASPAWRRLPGTEGVKGFFWSPDSQSLGFLAGGQLKTLKLAGGAPVTICSTPVAVTDTTPGGAWSHEGIILFGGRSSLWKVPAIGGTPTPVTAKGANEVAHRWPSFLPDGSHFLYLAQTRFADELRIGSLASTETKSLGPFQSDARYAAGYLLFVDGGRLMAQPFDPDSRLIKADAVVLAEQTAVDTPLMRRGLFSVANTGRLVYSTTPRPMSRLTWIDRSGRPAGTVGEPGYYANLGLSADDSRVAVSRLWQPPGLRWNSNIWSIDVNAGTAADRLTTNPAVEADPAFSYDGKQIAFNSSRTGTPTLFRRPSSRAGEDEPLGPSKGTVTAPDWSRDGRFLMFTEDAPETRTDLWYLSFPDRKKTSYLRTSFDERSGTFSPDGRWVAYESNVTGRLEIYVDSFPEPTGPSLISRDGGRAPRWRGDGRELFFLAPDGTMMAAGIETANGIHPTTPGSLFKTGITAPNNYHPFAVAHDGRRFLIPVRLNTQDFAPITVVLNWPAKLTR